MVGMKSNKSRFFNSTEGILSLVLIGAILGFIVFAGIRMIKYNPPQHVHYHANFQVFINGVQETFQDPLYYQEIATCSKYNDIDPIHRAHMHDEVYDVVHVHAPAVTWGHFFENINVGDEPTSIRFGNSVYSNNSEKKVTYILNGKILDSLVGQSIHSEDKLLINYGSEDLSTLTGRYQAIPNKAREYNLKKDPASCSGETTPTLLDRWNHIFSS